MNFEEDNWLAYREANLRFAEAVRQLVRKGDMVWVQDYHLMLLPVLLRELLDGRATNGAHSAEVGAIKNGIHASADTKEVEDEDATNVKIGFFLHTPFPSSEIYR
jgi:trehalose 6-phosphate synthase